MVTALAGLAQAACPTSVEDVADGVELALAAFASDTFDDAALSAAIADTEASVACLAEALPPAGAAGVFRARALGRFVALDDAGALPELRAAAALDSGWRWPDAVGRADHPLHSLLSEAAARGQGPTRPLPPPWTGWLLVDGERAAAAPVEVPFVLQVVDAEGAVVATEIVPARGAPAWTPGPPPAVAPAPVEPVPRRRVRSPALLGGGVASAAAGAAALGGAAAARHAFLTTPPARSDGTGLVVASWTLGLSGYALVSAGAGLGVAAIVVDRW